MQHMKLCVPGASVTATVLPGSTNTRLAGFSGYSGARISGLNGEIPAGAGTPFNCGMDPPPKAATSVNVCSSPPLLVTRRAFPAPMSRYEGSNRQAGCPTTVLISGENSSATNSENVVSPGRGKTTHKPAGNVLGSQLSTNATFGS